MKLGMLHIAAAAFLVSCADPKEFDNGQPVPNFRIGVSLAEAMQPAELYSDFVELSSDLGLDVYQGLEVTEEALRSGGLQRKFNWIPRDQKKTPYRISFIWEPRGSTQLTGFTVIVHNARAMQNDLPEWQLFGLLKNDLIPRKFVDAEIAVLRHPGVFTSDERSIELQALTGL